MSTNINTYRKRVERIEKSMAPMVSPAQLSPQQAFLAAMQQPQSQTVLNKQDAPRPSSQKVVSATVDNGAKRKRQAQAGSSAPVVVPATLESLDKPSLIVLVRALDAERKANDTKKPRTLSSVLGKTAAAAPPRPLSEAQLNKLKAQMTKKTAAAIKKCKVTSQAAKPWVEVHEGMLLSTAKALIGAVGTQKSDTKKYYTRTLQPAEVTQFLPSLPAINKAEFTGKTWSLGPRGKVYTSVAFEKAEFKYDKSSSMLVLRLRLYNHRDW